MKYFFVSIRKLKIISFLLGILIINPVHAGIIEGEPTGKVTLVEFYDYTCPYCHVMNPVLNNLIQHNPQLRIIYRPLPILHPQSWWIAASVIASTKQRDFLVLHEALMNAREPLTKNHILALASHAGIDPQQLEADIEKPDVKEELQSNISVANRIGIQQLPAIIIGPSQAKAPTAVFYGVTSLAPLQAAINKAVSE